MKKIDVGQAVTLVANFCVVVGLVFVALEIRQSRIATELQSVSDVMNGWTSLNEGIAHDPHVARVFVMGLYRPESLSTVEAAQFSMILRRSVDQVARVWEYRQRGLVTEADYQSAIADMTALMETPGGKEFRESDPRFDEEWLEEMKPYLGKETQFDPLLGRDPALLEQE